MKIKIPASVAMLAGDLSDDQELDKHAAFEVQNRLEKIQKILSKIEKQANDRPPVVFDDVVCEDLERVVKYIKGLQSYLERFGY